MARYKDYIQDEDKPFGTGTFQLDDGSEYYLDDPERARKVLEELYGGAPNPAAQIMSESTNIAERGSADRRGEELSKKSQLQNAIAKLAGVPEPNRPFAGIDTGADPMRRAVAGPGGGGEPLESRETGDNQSRVPAEDLESRDPGDDQAGQVAPPTEEQMRSAQAAERYANAAVDVARSAARGPAAGTRIDQSYSRKGGLPAQEYGQQYEARRGAFEATNEAIGRHYRENAAASDLQAQQLEAQALEQRKANAAQALELKRREQKYIDDRAWLEKDVDDFYDKSKPDGSRWFKDGGVFRQLGTAIAQFMGAYASVISGSPNFANAIIDKKIDRDVDDQIQAFRMGKMKRDGQLQRMAERGMSLEQMKSALKLQQDRVVQKEIQAAAERQGTREAKQAAESMLLQRQEKFVAEENRFRTEALGQETVSGTIARGSGPMSPADFDKRVAELLEARNNALYQARGGAPAERADERSYQRDKDAQDRADRREANTGKTNEDQAKAEAAWNTIEAYGDAVGIKKDPRSGARVADQSLFSRDTLIAPGQREALNDITGQGKPIEAARRAAIEGIGRLQSGGVISPSEAENFQRLLGDEHATRAQIATNLNALRVLVQGRRSAAHQQESTAAPSYWKR